MAFQVAFGQEELSSTAAGVNNGTLPAPGSASGSLWVTGYYQDYAICSMPPAQVDYSAMTHIIYFHTDVDVNVAPHFLPVVSPAESLRIEWSNSYQGCARTSGESYQAELIRRSHTAGVKVLLCLGGIWGSGADRMALLAADSVKTQLWANSMVAYLVRKGFDGIDLDWEFPRVQGDYMRMLRILRRSLDSMPARGIFVAAVYGDANNSAYDYPNLKNYLDQVNVMTYDMWNNQNTAWLNSPLGKAAGSPNNWRTWRTSSALSWAAKGVPKSILSNGIPFYSWRFSGVTALGQPLGGYSYAGYSDAVNALNNGGTFHWDDSAKSPYVTYTNNGVNYMITYDDTNSVKYKVQRIKDDGIGGIMIYGLWDGWLSNQPAGKRDPLLQALKAAVGGTIVPPPTLSSPSEGALNIPTSTELDWSDVAGAATYGLQLAADAQFTTLVVNQVGLTASSFPVTGLAEDAAYFWRANARNLAGTSAWSATRTFRTATPTRIRGQAFFDADQSQTKGGAEPSMAGWVVTLTGPVTETAITDSTGWYAFGGIPNGVYTVSVALKSLWSQTAPFIAPVHTVTVTDGATFDDKSFGLYSPGAFSFPVDRLWNIVSVPVRNPIGLTEEIFTLATSSSYSFNDGYSVEDRLVDGSAYWTKFGTGHAVWTAGATVTTTSTKVMKGWNFVGSISTPVPVAHLSSIPPGIILGNVYGYRKGNFLADTIHPGRGYWVQASDSGTVVIQKTIAGGNAFNKDAAGAGMEGLSAVTFSTASGESQSLYFGVDRTSRRLARHDMPPVPPAGAFDARFLSEGSLGEIARVLRATADRAIELPLELRSATYPLAISWEIRPGDDAYALRLPSGEKVTLVGSGTMTVAQGAVSGDGAVESMAVVIEGNAPGAAPASFALDQNYPNPFNSGTLVRFTIPTASAVRLEVYNLLGERVATLLDRELASGAYTVPFDAPGLPTGIYFSRLSAFTSAGESITKTMRMVLSK